MTQTEPLTPLRCLSCGLILGWQDGVRFYSGTTYVACATTLRCVNCHTVRRWTPGGA